MKIIILSKRQIDAVENGLSTFLAEDLIDSFESQDTLILTDVERLPEWLQRNPAYKFTYVVSVEKG